MKEADRSTRSLRLASTALAAFAIFAPFNVTAARVARAITTVMGGSATLYNVDENGTWTSVRTIYSTGSPYMLRAVRCVYRDGVVYAADMIKDPNKDGTGGYIRKFTLDGTYLGDLGHFPGQAEGLCFSSDGNYLYIGYAFQLLAGQIDRMSLADGTVETFKTGLGPIRQICTDGKGRLYAAARISGPITIIDEATGETLKSVAKAAQGIAYDPKNDVLWWCQSGSSYGTMDRDGNNLVTYSGGPIGNNCFAAAVLDGLPHFAGYGEKVYRRETDGTFTTVVNTTANYSDLTMLPAYDMTAHWTFNESANAPAFTNAISPVLYPIYPSGLLQSGATGVAGGCAYFGGTAARGMIEGSRTLIPATGDFTLAFWAGVPATTQPQEQYIFSNHGIINGRLNIMANLDGTTNTLCFFFGPQGTETYKIFSTNTFADGAWHHVALTRANGEFSLWMDGALEGSVACHATNRIGQFLDWCLGCSSSEVRGQTAPGAFVDDLRIYDGAMSANQIAELAASVTPGAAPTCPAAPSGATALPSALGTEVAHAYACDAPIGAPSLLAIPDGSCYLAASRGNRPFAHDQKTTVYKSTDGGVTWTSLAEVALGNGALFALDGAIGLMGNAPGSLTDVQIFLSFNGGTTWAEYMRTTTSRFLPNLSTTPPVFAQGRLWQGLTHIDNTSHRPYPGAISFAVNGTTFSDMKFVNIGYTDHGVFLNNPAYDLICGYLPGPVASVGDAVRAIYPIDDRHPASVDAVLGVERYACTDITSTDFRMYPFFGVPGASKRFSVAYDAVSGLYWAATVAVTNCADLATMNGNDIRNVLALYASPDLMAWRPCGIVTVTDAATFDAPAIAVVGDDLVLAYTVATDDGAGGPRSPVHGNYLATRRVTSFRTAYEPFTPGGQHLLLGEFSRHSVLSYYPGPDGQWYSGGLFATNAGAVVGIAAGFGRVYVSREVPAPGKIDVYTYDGTFISTITAPEGVGTDNIKLAKSGAYLLVADPFKSNAVYRYSLVTGTWTKLCDTTSGLPNQVRGIAIDPRDNSFYAMGRNGKSSIRRFDMSGALLETIVAELANSSHLALELDAENNMLYYAEIRGKTYKIDLTDGTRTPVLIESLDVNIPLAATADLLSFDGTLYAVGGAAAGHKVRLDGGKTTWGVFPKSHFPLRMAILDRDSGGGGTMIIIR